MAFISNFNGAASDLGLFQVESRIAQSSALQGNLFAARSGIDQSALASVFGGLGGLSFPPIQLGQVGGSFGPPFISFPPVPLGMVGGSVAPPNLSFPPVGLGSVGGPFGPSPLAFPNVDVFGVQALAGQMLQGLSGLAGGWSGMLGGGAAPSFGMMGAGRSGCH